MIDTFQKENNLKIIYNLKKNDYEDLVAAVRSGDIDMIWECITKRNYTKVWRRFIRQS